MPNANELKYILKNGDEDNIEIEKEFDTEKELFSLFKHALLYIIILAGVIICFYYSGNILKMFN